MVEFSLETRSTNKLYMNNALIALLTLTSCNIALGQTNTPPSTNSAPAAVKPAPQRPFIILVTAPGGAVQPMSELQAPHSSARHYGSGWYGTTMRSGFGHSGNGLFGNGVETGPFFGYRRIGQQVSSASGGAADGSFGYRNTTPRATSTTGGGVQGSFGYRNANPQAPSATGTGVQGSFGYRNSTPRTSSQSGGTASPAPSPDKSFSWRRQR